MACWERKVEGLGPYLRLQSSMKTGSIAYSSEIKLPTHTGTHVDAPGHMIDRYFDAGIDVDTLDLDVLNELSTLPKRCTQFEDFVKPSIT
ncbi:hypothetical protein Scep_001014 [Stephania cephalantha]|uniref:Cyclase n=1 Tax=Stephania cephalantha TaxID=152367 RepID=A0AAP0L769_9MAGN